MSIEIANLCIDEIINNPPVKDDKTHEISVFYKDVYTELKNMRLGYEESGRQDFIIIPYNFYHLTKCYDIFNNDIHFTWSDCEDDVFEIGAFNNATVYVTKTITLDSEVYIVGYCDTEGAEELISEKVMFNIDSKNILEQEKEGVKTINKL
jgi:hypothetical protein